jgi:thioredoxin
VAGFPIVAESDLARLFQHRGLVVVDFFTPGCIPCQKIEPMLVAVAREHPGQIRVVKVDASANRALAGQYGVRAGPTLLLFKDRQLVDRRTGFAVASQLREWIEPHLDR